MDFPTKFFLLGAVGALIPEVYRLYRLATHGDTFHFTPFYIVMSIVFALVAGLLAAYLPSENERAALYAGISAPVLINTVGKTAVTRARQKKVAKGSTPTTSRIGLFFNGL